MVPLCSVFRRFLKRKGLKFTSERARILEAVLSKRGVFGPEELLDELRHGPEHVSKATIYRTIKHLQESGIITQVLLDAKQAHYRLSIGREAAGHLVCIETNRIIDFTTPELTELTNRICKQYGFDPVSYRFVIYGVSPEARKLHDAAPAEA